MSIPNDAWEYHIRKSLNDAAYQSLEYAPYCSTMPVAKTCTEPRFMWVSEDCFYGRRHTIRPDRTIQDLPFMMMSSFTLFISHVTEAQGEALI